ncbi:Zinc finger CCCH domain-containing protein [Drosera capensis]
MADATQLEAKSDNHPRSVRHADDTQRPFQQKVPYHFLSNGFVLTPTSHDCATQGPLTSKINMESNDVPPLLDQIGRVTETDRVETKINGRLSFNLKYIDPQPDRSEAEINGRLTLNQNDVVPQPMSNGHLFSRRRETYPEKASISPKLPSSDQHVIDIQNPAPLSKKEVPIIELSDDDDEDADKPSSSKQTPAVLPDDTVWYYVDPQGSVQGPVSVASLKRWRDAGYFPPDFKVWRKGQTRADTVLLADVLLQMFSCGATST